MSTNYTLVLRGVTKSTYIPPEDVFENKLIAESCPSHIDTNVNLESLPKIFTTLSAWPKSTNLRCWTCFRKYSNVPLVIFISYSKTADGDDQYITEGNFCHWTCARWHIKYHKNDDPTLKKLLLKFYTMITGKVMIDIPLPSSPWTQTGFVADGISPENYIINNEQLLLSHQLYQEAHL
jgi:hypothetical protein